MSVIHVFTDGACSGNPGPAGIGAYLVYEQHKKQLSEYIGEATNNDIFNNIFKENQKSGLSIRYANLICEGNRIYQNNFINNGPYERGTTQFCNAVDNNNETNVWNPWTIWQ